MVKYERIIEKEIKSSENYPTIKQLQKKLIKKISNKEVENVIKYLLSKNKIIINKKRITWIFNPECVKKILKNGLVIK